MQDLVLLGGGHAHVETLRRFGMKPLPGVRLTLITRDVHTPYSGMLPGYVSGFYSFDDCHIDLARLARFANARLVHAEARGIDPSSRKVIFADRPSYDYDVLSINIGITPQFSCIPGASEFATPVKPIDTLIDRLGLIFDRVKREAGAYRIAVVGGGAGGVELACAMQYRMHSERGKAASLSQGVEITLVSQGPILKEMSSYARNAALKAMKNSGIRVLENARVVRVDKSKELVLLDGQTVGFDDCLWCTQASPALWLKETGLPLADDGFLAVNNYLQSDGGPPEVFAVGDVATMTHHPRPKAGVYAVRAGPPLTDNLIRYLTGLSLTPYIPQTTNLALVTTGRKHCIASKGWFGTQGDYLWGLKDKIDRAFMEKYSTELNFEQMENGMETMSVSYSTPLGKKLQEYEKKGRMRCGGCGGKIGASVLRSVLNEIFSEENGHLNCSLNDDAAVLSPPSPEFDMIQTIDYFREVCEDPYVFGQIAAQHALNDCYAMGGTPTSALALVVLPFMSSTLMERDLRQMMRGAKKVFTEARCAVVGGHTAEGAEAALGFSVTGQVKKGESWCKNGLKVGNVLVLTKPLGTGVVMAGAMKGLALGRWLISAKSSMLVSNRTAMDVFKNYTINGCTDISGFGLLGHALEMLHDTKCGIQIDTTSLPLLPGSKDCAGAGAESSLFPDNEEYVRQLAGSALDKNKVEDVYWRLLCDPQTAGGLLAGIPEEEADECLRELKASGYCDAAIVGRVVNTNTYKISLM